MDHHNIGEEFLSLDIVDGINAVPDGRLSRGLASWEEHQSGVLLGNLYRVVDYIVFCQW
jgi:hypothetical protein